MLTINMKNQAELETALKIDSVLGHETLLKNYEPKGAIQWLNY